MRNDRAQVFDPFSTAQWLAWLGAILVAAVTVVAYAYTTFETKDEARDHDGTTIQRLDRMENKLDRIVEQTKGS